MKALVVCKNYKEKKEKTACSLIDKKGFKTICSWKNTLAKKHLSNIDLVIAIGGDGTILSASHYLLDKPLLAVNSSPKTSEGALATLPLSQLSVKLNQISGRQFKTEKLERIQILINNKPLPILALNEVFIANSKSYLISKYKIKFKKKEEMQKSSGIIISTGTGSTAWFKSAGGVPFSQKAEFIKMIIREPYFGTLNRPSMLKETIQKNQSITIIPLVPSILTIDSIREYSLKRSDKITIKVSPHPLIRIK